MLGGLGSGNNAVASMAMVVSTSDKSQRMHNIGLIETATGIGFLLGPLWGSVMYHIGGYPAPFACSGKFSTTLLFLTFSWSISYILAIRCLSILPRA